MKNSKLFKEALRDFLIWWVAAQLVLYAIVYIEYRLSPSAVYHINFGRTIPLSALVGFIAVYHYFFLYLRFFQKGKYGYYVLGILAVLAAGVTIDGAVISLTMRTYENGLRLGFVDTISSGVLRHAFLYTPAALFYTLIKANIKLRKRRKELERQELESSLAVLKGQLDPHFLFNALNTVYATAQQEGAKKTAGVIEELSGLFRYSIQEAGQKTVPVEKELAFADKYLHMQKLRLPENKDIQVDTHVYWDKQPASIAPMLILPFIENAYKYGISYREPSLVKVDIQVEKGRMLLDVVNTNHAAQQQVDSTGIGLKNVVKRLELQYPGRYGLQRSEEDGRYHVSLNIDLDK